jgi:hypothetical protein
MTEAIQAIAERRVGLVVWVMIFVALLVLGVAIGSLVLIRRRRGQALTSPH